jgi:hypothetical protein
VLFSRKAVRMRFSILSYCSAGDTIRSSVLSVAS